MSKGARPEIAGVQLGRSRATPPDDRAAAASTAPPASEPLLGAGRKKGLVKVMYRMHPRHVAALRAEAFRRSEKLPVGRPDASEVLREIVEAWLDDRAAEPSRDVS